MNIDEQDKLIRYLGLMLLHCAMQWRDDPDDDVMGELDMLWIDGTAERAEQDWRDGARRIAEIVPKWPKE